MSFVFLFTRTSSLTPPLRRAVLSNPQFNFFSFISSYLCLFCLVKFVLVFLFTFVFYLFFLYSVSLFRFSVDFLYFFFFLVFLLGIFVVCVIHVCFLYLLYDSFPSCFCSSVVGFLFSQFSSPSSFLTFDLLLVFLLLPLFCSVHVRHFSGSCFPCFPFSLFIVP